MCNIYKLEQDLYEAIEYEDLFSDKIDWAKTALNLYNMGYRKTNIEETKND